MEDQLANNNVKLKFNVLDESNTIQVEILDSDGNTIRKIPGDDLVKLSKSPEKSRPRIPGQDFLSASRHSVEYSPRPAVGGLLALTNPPILQNPLSWCIIY